tara:strand:- start:590 stop:751 length:162 start_codon:yes stop_codon:yes gene_type:complete
MRNPVAKNAHKFNKSYAMKDKTKYDRVKERCSHWDLDYLTREELKELVKDGNR